MKKIIYLLTIVGLLFTGCDPIEDINNEIDGRDNPVVGSADYTLTDEDYEELELGFGSFSSIDDAKTMLPPFLADKLYDLVAKRRYSWFGKKEECIFPINNSQFLID